MAAKKKAAKRRKPESRKPEARAANAPASGLRLPAAVPHAEGKWSEWFTRKPGERRYWLVKSEPEVFSFDDLVLAPKRTTHWDGVRNFAARKSFMRERRDETG